MTPTMSLTRQNVRRGTFAAAGVSATFKPVGSYGRLSEDKALKTGRTDREEGEQVATQFKRNRVLSESLNWTIVREYNDNNIPASDPLIVRPDFEQMLKDLESGVIEGIVFTHSDRVARLEYDAARINRLYTINPKLVGRSVDGGTDLSTVEGRAMFMMQATMGGVEVYNTKRRTSGTNLANAEKGRRHHGRRAFGWNSDGTLHPEESRLLAAAIRAVPGGLRVGNFRKQLIALGYEPRPDKRRKEGAAKYNLQHSTVESYLVNPAVCGYVAYLAQADRRGGKKVWLPDHVLYVDGQPVKGNWPKIVEPEEWAACVETLEKRKQDRKDGNQQPHDTSDKYVLSGFVRCGKCSFPLLANPYTKGTTAYEKWGYRYACLSNQGGCGGITRVGPPIEELVIRVFLAEVRRSLGVVTKAEEIDETKNDARLREIDKEIEEVNVRRRERRISAIRALDLIEELEKEQNDLRRERRKLQALKVQREDASPNLLKDWDGYSVSEKKQRLRQSIRAVMVHPAGRGKRFDPELIEIVWA